MKKLILAQLILMSEITIAAGSGHGASTLIAPAVNFTILLVGLAYFLGKPAKEFFATKSTSISDMMAKAESKAKEAQMMMEVQSKKSQGSEAEIKKLEEENSELISAFEKNYKNEVQDRILKMKEDAGQKIEAEKTEMINSLNSNLLDIVIANAKNTIKADGNLAQSAAKSIVEKL